MKKLNEDFKSGKFEQVYLLYGEEGYLKKQYKKRFIKAMIPEGDTMNYAHYEGKNIPVKEVIDLAETGVLAQRLCHGGGQGCCRPVEERRHALPSRST